MYSDVKIKSRELGLMHSNAFKSFIEERGTWQKIFLFNSLLC